MSKLTATTTRPLGEISPSGQLPAAESAAYVYVGNGKFEPANAAAHEECRRWNAWVEEVNARASRSARQ